MVQRLKERMLNVVSLILFAPQVVSNGGGLEGVPGYG